MTKYEVVRLLDPDMALVQKFAADGWRIAGVIGIVKPGATPRYYEVVWLERPIEEPAWRFSLGTETRAAVVDPKDVPDVQA